MGKIYVTFCAEFINKVSGIKKYKYAIKCKDLDEAKELFVELYYGTGFKNIRINKCGRVNKTFSIINYEDFCRMCL